MLRPRNIGKYRDLLLLFTRYGLKDFRVSLDPADFLLPPEQDADIEPDVKKRAMAFATALKTMGPTYVKFGQVLSTRPDIVPPEYIEALESLQNSVEPFSFADVERIVEEELGVRISKAFESFESKPLAAASLGQAHRAVLRDGRDVVVKVQRPNVRESVRNDLDVLLEIAQVIEQHTSLGRNMNLIGSIEQARLTMIAELNYVQEAESMAAIRANLAEFPQIYIPNVIRDYSTERVLTTELVRGDKVSKLTPLQLIDGDYSALATVLTEAYLKQICVDGFWHSDPHPGNVFLRGVEDPQIVLLDFGMVGHLSQDLQDEIIKLLLAVAGNRGVEVAETCIRVSEVAERFEPTKFIREISTLVAHVHGTALGNINTGQVLFNVIGIASRNDLKAPPELAMLAKTLLNLDGITRKLDPHYDAQAVIRRYAERLMTQKLQQKFHPHNFYSALLDLNQLVLDLPHRAREILDETAAGRLTFGIKVAQAEEFLAGMHKIANRITVGVVIAALLVASSMMMRVPTPFTIFGYPGVAMLGYLAAVIAAVSLIISTFLADHKDQESAKLKGR